MKHAVPATNGVPQTAELVPTPLYVMYSPSITTMPAIVTPPPIGLDSKPATLVTFAIVSVALMFATSFGGVAGPIPIQAPGVIVPLMLTTDAEAWTCEAPPL